MEGDTIPAPLLSKPELYPHQQTLLDAFYLLSPDRPIGMGGVGAIPTVAIYAAADHVGEDPQTFLALCRALDAVYMEHISKRK